MVENTSSIRPLRREDLAAADHIFRLAFGTFLGLPDPVSFGGDTDYVRTRWLADSTAAFAAEAGGQLAGSNFATPWGSVGFFGPLTVHPEFWGRGIARRLMEPVMELFDRWQIRHAGLMTHAHSPLHLALYQRFGFAPRFLTALMSKPVQPGSPGPHSSRYSALTPDEQRDCLSTCYELTDAIYAGLDVKREIRAVNDQKLGETMLLWDDARLAGLAVCHCGPGTEAGSGRCYVKFGAVRPGPQAELTFNRLLDAVEALAAAQGLSQLVAGMNTARYDAYRRLAARGFRTDQLGVAMHKPNEPGYNRPDVYLIDDWR